MAAPFDDIPAWPPARFTPSLDPDFVSAFDGYAPLVQKIWARAFGHVFEPWQLTTIRHVFELYPDGHLRAGQLRYRQVVVSLGRQNGKTEIAAAIGLVALLMRARPTVVGLATNVDQARLIYKRTMSAIHAAPELKYKFKALTETRGIQTADGGSYEIKASRSAALQGIPIDVGLVDELHVLARDLWFDLVNGLGGRPNSFVVGITTAGSQTSELLLHLYAEGDKAIAANESRFGFFVWEALTAEVPDGDLDLGRELCRANPSLASGRVDLETAIEEVRSMPPQDAIRYRLNRFVDSVSTFITSAAWSDNWTPDPFPTGVAPIFVVDRTPDWGYASVGAFAALPDGRIYCDLVASIVKPTLSGLADLCEQLNQHAPVTFAMDSFTLRDLGRELERRGLNVTLATFGDVLNASAMFYAKVATKALAHPGHDLLTKQIPVTKRKDSGDGFKISRQESSVAIDGVMTHVLGVYYAATLVPDVLQMF